MRMFSLSLWLCVLSSEGMQTELPFRVGFEFQMDGKLCDWALSDCYQKQELFSSPLGWHVEFDGTDIEFVTVPFERKEDASTCISEICASLDALMELLNGSPVLQTNVGLWYKNCLDKNIKLNVTDFFSMVSDRTITKMSSTWEPRWKPQVTIQHPLRRTVDLCWELSKSERSNPVRDGLPFFMSMSKQEAEYNTSIGGLMFLEGHQVLGMARSSALLGREMLNMLPYYNYAIPKERDFSLMAGTLYDYRAYHQFDVKRRTRFMSRRPFSHMLREIVEAGSPEKLTDAFSRSFISSHASYYEAFEEAMKDTDTFSTLQVEKMFSEANYAEQFYSSDKLSPLDLGSLFSYFDERTRNQQVKIGDSVVSLLAELLKEGLPSTVMLKHLNLDGLLADGRISVEASKNIRMLWEKGYYRNVLESTLRPEKYHRGFLKIENNEKGVLFIDLKSDSDSASDLLSPPFLLDNEDSIGRLKELSKESLEKFGGAVVEFRAIEYFQSSREERGPGTFLVDPRRVLEDISELIEKVNLVCNK